MTGTNVPTPQWTPTGLVLPTEQDILSGVTADIDAAFGGGVNPSLTTPQGQLATAEAATIGNSNSELLQVINAMDPAFSYGRFQDALGRIYFLTRRPATPSTVLCTCVGAASTIIPVGALVTDGTNVWSCVDGGTIPLSGSVNLTFACTTTGPVAATSSSINTIYRTVPGWDTVTNGSDAILGADVETRAEFEQRRVETVQANSVAVVQALKGAVLKVPNVTDAYVFSNDTAGDDTITGVVLHAHEVYAAVTGGDAVDVATALWEKKPPGSPWWSDGNTTETIQDTLGYDPPYPSYDVIFEVPVALDILFEVTITDSLQVPSDGETQVKNAIISAFAGGDGGPRARIGSLVYASRFYAPVAALGAWARIVSIKVGTGSANADEVQVPINKAPATSGADISVVFS